MDKVEKSVQETKKHIKKVKDVGNRFCMNLSRRLLIHDKSKLEDPEKTMFAKHTDILNKLEYGTKEYKDQLELMKQDCLFHHYENNSHHPEHYENGINDMDIMDIIEMLIDWKSSGERTKDGDFQKSLEYNMERFHVEEPLRSIILRSRKYFYTVPLEIFYCKKCIYTGGFSTIKEFEMIKDKLSEYLSESEINIITSICVDIYFCDYEKMLTDEKQIITISGDCFIELF